MTFNRHIIVRHFYVILATVPFELELNTEQQMRAILDQCKVTIPEMTHIRTGVEDSTGTLKDIMATAQKERENSAKVPDLNKKTVETVADDGSRVLVDKISECTSCNVVYIFI